MQELDPILSKVSAYYPAADLALVRRAYDFAAKAHHGQTRKSGEPYVSHPLSVAGIIAELRLDLASVCAGLLHDCVEDTSATVDELTQLFGKEIAFLVDGVTKLGKLPYSTREEQQAENFRKMLLAMARDIRVILVKLCDRLDNMRSLGHLAPDKQERIAAETMQIYAPLANRLGIQWIKVELEDLSFRYLHPVEYEQLAAEVDKTREEQLAYIRHVEGLILEEMRAGGVEAEVAGRAKHLWSIYQKMKKTGRRYDEIHDAIGFRVITSSDMYCYQALGVAHQKWTPIPGRFKDYIALPKPNMYQSLHTAVIGPKGERIEVQIRTREMQLVAEHGIAAHWKYKEGRPVAADDEKKFAWLRQLMEAQKELRDPTEFLESVKIDLFGDEVYVFTPQGDVKALPKGACPIDLAYEIHSGVGDHCSGARVNGMIVPLRYQLRNGDTVEIITSPNQKPNKDWLKLVKTSKARTKIRYLLRKEQRDRAVALGKDLLEKGLRKHGASVGRLEKQLAEAARDLRCADVDELIIQLGYGKVTVQQVLDRVLPDGKKQEPAAPDKPEGMFRQLLRKVTRRQSTSGIKVAGEQDILVRFAKCCSPLPGDPIVGFITRGRGVTVHRRDCDKGLDLDPERRIDVEWDGTSKAQHEVAIQVLCADKPGLLAHLSQSFTDSGVNISQAHCRATDDGRAVNTFHASVRDLDQLKVVMRALTRIKGVYSVDRVSADPGG
ncbi:MAG: bifunctional (p)ppGpp synthetase/guanosine-3',5'-bis(diphosphate) 3'-pyrophosphohydrolase [Kofleriaceae bacterium]|jgi:guanosine-3',5'-bis(diphosphate) 3'-pyrophosphohydrolase|nr:bifunctional (p)ppGpp synthetase/guanosine-3',5'-bis(diphosphate) 3'-pyrophosphohydrolase [Kofleriaceae bacterium]MBP6840838.1 bifunctional (p)ppGpp synthetase/guanosine-3',5'-bis(diphosphate) 3'-pyrophosphohydrolase [Kofleriaceae bacterium]MBP9203207.1 bifunctional (p)ppGpp synthetase/guanosine-3',5'-bis(diphosphate) 3'-pyrophosphohydrolase [Kofleriaceae bacterium]